MSSVLPLGTSSWSSTRVAVSIAAGSAGSFGEIEQRWDGRVEGQHSKLGLGGTFSGETEDSTADRDIPHARAELVDDARRLVTQGLREPAIHQALALLHVTRVDAGRAHRNPNLT